MNISPPRAQYTSIEQIFGFEIQIIKILGGFLPEFRAKSKNGKYYAIIYQVSVIIISRLNYIIYEIQDRERSKGTESSSQATWKYFRFIWYLFLISTYAIIVVNFATGLKYNSSMSIVLKKRLNCGYFSKDYFDYQNDINTDSIDHIGDERKQEHLMGTKIRIMGNNCSACRQNRGLSYIKLTRYFIIAYTIGVAFSLAFHLRHPITPETFKTSGTFNTNLSNRKDIFGETYIKRFTTDNNDTNKYRLKITLAGSLDSLNTILKLIIPIIYPVLQGSIAALVFISQTHGQILVSLMITATIAEMLRYSRNYESLVLVKKRINCVCTSREYNIIQQQKSPHLLMTTKLLIQTRDVLITLRCVTSLNYLMILLFELTHLVVAVCLLNNALSSKELNGIIVSSIDYILVILSMSISRLGHHWVHSEVDKLKRYIEETNLVEMKSLSKYDQNLKTNQDGSKETTVRLKRIERITMIRLADDICSLWPTDWFTPDWKSLLNINIFVVTIVATLEQLLETGERARNMNG